MKKVLLLAPQPYFRLRGMCLAQRDLLRAMSANGMKVEVLCYPGGRDSSVPGVKVTRLPYLRDVPIGLSWAKVLYAPLMLAWTAWNAGRFHAVHACEESAFIAAFLKPYFRFRFVYDMDDVLSKRLEALRVVRWRWLLELARRAEEWMLSRADAVITNSYETTVFARAAVGRHKVFFYHHFPPVEAEIATERRLEARKRALGIGKRRMVLYAGNLENYQGVELLLESLPALLRKQPDACLVVVGGQEQQVEQLRSAARALGVEKNVKLLGQRPLRIAFRLMPAADVLVSPMTQVKAVPMKLYAYLAAGRPIVATALPNHEQLLSAKHAVLVEPRPQSLADGLSKVLGDSDLSSRLSAAAAELAERRLHTGACAKALERAYR